MKAIICTKYGAPEVLVIREVEKPVPGDNEVLIRVHATSVSSGDVRLRKADPFAVRFFLGLTRPKKKILGFTLAGNVEATGRNVQLFKEADAVFGTTGLRFGAYAEYICLDEKGILTKKADNISFEEAAAIPFGGHTALYFLRKANIRPGQKVLIYGASGAIGSAAVQLAKFFGAEVTGVCSTSNMDMVKNLGADHVIDYTVTDFSKTGEAYDAIFDTVGKSSFTDCIKSLKKKGVLLLASAGPAQMSRGILKSMTSTKKVISGLMREKAEDILFMKKLLNEGQLKAVIDRIYPLEQIAEAHRYVEMGHKKGNVVITIP